MKNNIIKPFFATGTILVFAAIGTFCLSGCENTNSKEYQDKRRQMSNEGLKNYAEIVEWRSETGEPHEYVYLSPGNYGSGLCHYPDCKHCKAKTAGLENQRKQAEAEAEKAKRFAQYQELHKEFGK